MVNEKDIEQFGKQCEEIFTQVSRDVIGQKEVVEGTIIAMIAGRLVWGAVSFVLIGASGGAFTFSAFMAGAFLNAWPGILLQIIFVPPLVMILDSPKLLRFN